MSWRTMEVQDQRVRFVIAASRGEQNMSELCREFDISRPTGYQWLRRYRTAGVAGIREESRRPRRSPRRTVSAIEQRIAELRCLTDAAGRSPGHWQESWCNWNVWSSGCWCSTATPSFANSTLPWSRKEKTAALPPWKTLRVSHFPFLRLPRLTNPKYQKSVKDVWRRCVKDVPRLYRFTRAIMPLLKTALAAEVRFSIP